MQAREALAPRCKLAPLLGRFHPDEAGLADSLSAISSTPPERFGFPAHLPDKVWSGRSMPMPHGGHALHERARNRTGCLSGRAPPIRALYGVGKEAGAGMLVCNGQRIRMPNGHPNYLADDCRYRCEVATRAIGMVTSDRSVGSRCVFRNSSRLALMLMHMMAEMDVGHARFMPAIARGSPPDELDRQQHQHDEDKGFAHASDGSSRNALWHRKHRMRSLARKRAVSTATSQSLQKRNLAVTPSIGCDF